MQRFFILILIQCQKNKLANKAPIANNEKTLLQIVPVVEKQEFVVNLKSALLISPSLMHLPSCLIVRHR